MPPATDAVKDINILLLGESGVGKSTFINACYNYFKHNSLDQVLAGKLEVLIPAKFEITDANFEQKTVQLGDVTDNNECLEVAKAATQDVKVYNFPVEIDGKKYRVRFMDTPGIGDERGAERDQYNCERILAFLSQMTEIHGFCLLLKPSNARLDVFMNYCITQLLSRLESSAVNNVMFVFTNSRGENFTPGKTRAPLKVLVDQFKENSKVVIPFDRKNMFCLDNEGFRFAGAIRNGVELDEDAQFATEMSWKRSSRELWRMIEYVVGITPHDLRKTMLINESKMMASLLSKPLCEILNIIQDNLRIIQNTTNELNDATLTREELEKKMRTPRFELQVTKVDKAQTVCSHPDCTQNYEVNGIKKVHYKRPCCRDCMGPMRYCRIFGSFVTFFTGVWICIECHHSYEFHDQIYYKTVVVPKDIDESMIPKIDSQNDLIAAKKQYLEGLQTQMQEYENERHFILETCAIIKQYLKENSITAKNDPTEEYLNYQLARCNEAATQIREILYEYTKVKQELAKVVVDNRQVNPEEIQTRKGKLFTLKNFGRQIANMFTLKSNLRETIRDREVQIRDSPFKKFH